MRISESTLRKYVRHLLVESSTRAAASKEADDVADIILSRLHKGWSVKSAAVTGSNAIDLVLSDGTTDVNVEVKAYAKTDKGSMTFFKAEIKLPVEREFQDDPSESQPTLPLTRRSALGKVTDMEKGDYPATPTGIRRRVLDPVGPEQMSKENAIAAIEAALQSPEAGYVSDKPIHLTKGGQTQVRYVYAMEGDPGDYERLRHQAPEKVGTGKGRRELFTIGTADVRRVGSKALKENDPETYETVAQSVRRDFGEDEYLALYNSAGTMRLFRLRGQDILGLNAPLLTGEAIEKWKYATTGGGIRPGVGITVKDDSGVVVSKSNVPRASVPTKKSKDPAISRGEDPEQLALQFEARLRAAIREALLRRI